MPSPANPHLNFARTDDLIDRADVQIQYSAARDVNFLFSHLIAIVARPNSVGHELGFHPDLLLTLIISLQNIPSHR